MEKLDFGKGAVPLYIQIKKIIKDKILSKEYAPGDSIPSEAQLQEIFHVSRITARQAIAQLESEGLVERAEREPEFCFKIKSKSSSQVSKALPMKCWSAVYSRGHAGHISSW